MLRFAVGLLAALTLAAAAAGTAAAGPPQRPAAQALYYSSYGNPRPLAPPAASSTATASSNGPTWTVAILGGVAVMLACGCAGVFAGRASVRSRPTVKAGA